MDADVPIDASSSTTVTMTVDHAVDVAGRLGFIIGFGAGTILASSIALIVWGSRSRY